MVATRQARAAAARSRAQAARLFESLDLGVLSVVASFGYPEELVELGVALGKARCCPQIDIPVTPKPDNVSPSSWWGYFNTHG